MGRPPKFDGKQDRVTIRMPELLTGRVDEWAEGMGLARADAILALIERGLDEKWEMPERPVIEDRPARQGVRPKLDTSSIGLPAGATLKPASSLLDQEKDNGFIRQMGLQSKAGKKR